MGRIRAEILQVQTNPLDLTDAQLRTMFGTMPDSDLMRCLIMTEVEAIRGGAIREARRTMRNVWYDHIKPVLSRAGRLDDRTSGGKEVDWPGKLSKYLAELVRAGETTYAELRIVDGSRQRRPATGVTLTIPIAKVRLVGAHYPWLILFTEKDTIWEELDNLASLYGVSAISGGGEPSAACTENIVDVILSSDAYHGEALTLLSLTDYDPAGYNIADSQYIQLQEMAGDRCAVRHDRLGLTPDQLTPAERAAKAYTPKEKGLAAWLQETGGVDGQPLGLELDALGFRELRSMFAVGIERYIDLAARRRDLRTAFVELLAWELLAPEVAAKKAAMIAQVESSGLGARIRNTDLPGNLFALAARAGWDSINPTEAFWDDGTMIFDCADDVRKVMASGRFAF